MPSVLVFHLETLLFISQYPLTLRSQQYRAITDITPNTLIRDHIHRLEGDSSVSIHIILAIYTSVVNFVVEAKSQTILIDRQAESLFSTRGVR